MCPNAVLCNIRTVLWETSRFSASSLSWCCVQWLWSWSISTQYASLLHLFYLQLHWLGSRVILNSLYIKGVSDTSGFVSQTYEHTGLPETCSKLWIWNLPPPKFSNNWCKSNTEVWACSSLTWWRWLHVRVSQILNHPCHVLYCSQLWIIDSVNVFSD